MLLSSRLIGLSLAAALLAPTTAMARETPLGNAARSLTDRNTQAAMAAALAALGNALLDLKVGPMLQAVEGMGGSAARESGKARAVSPDATLRDLAGPQAERMPEELAAKLPAMMDGMAGMAGAMEAMLPQLEAAARQMKRALPED